MASQYHNTETASLANDASQSTAKLRLSELRSLAQGHLKDIQAEDNIEAEAQSQSQIDLQKYTKMKRKDRQRSKSPGQAAFATSVSAAATMAGYAGNAELTKGPKLRSAGDILDRLKWDPSVQMEEYTIGYLERFDGITEMPAVNWIKESTDEDFIPQHRIKWVKRSTATGQEVVWDRERRIDKLFGSGIHDSSAPTVIETESVIDSIDGGVMI